MGAGLPANRCQGSRPASPCLSQTRDNAISRFFRCSVLGAAQGQTGFGLRSAQFLQKHRFFNAISLSVINPDLLEFAQSRLVFDEFSDGLHAHRMANLRD